MRAGKLCQTCSQCKCDPDELQNNFAQCPICEGLSDGCEHCQGGQFLIPGCPNQYVREIAGDLTLIDYFHQGILPISGGLLDQSASFVNAAKTLKHEDAIARNG